MFPIALDLTRVSVLLTGSGELLRKRLAYLDEAQASRVAVFAPDATPEIRAAAGARLVDRLPEAADLHDYTVIMAAGLPRAQAQEIVSSARALGKLVNVEDINDLCDFYFTANVRRGDLLIAVSTGGASPTLARKVRDAIAGIFSEEWTGRVQEIGNLRKGWKAQGLGFQELIDHTEQYLKDKGWLPSSPSPVRGEGGVGVLQLQMQSTPSPSLTLPPNGGGNNKKKARRHER